MAPWLILSPCASREPLPAQMGVFAWGFPNAELWRNLPPVFCFKY
jgi:hypothetical protein